MTDQSRTTERVQQRDEGMEDRVRALSDKRQFACAHGGTVGGLRCISCLVESSAIEIARLVAALAEQDATLSATTLDLSRESELVDKFKARAEAAEAQLAEQDARLSVLTQELAGWRELDAMHCACEHDGRGSLVSECQEHQDTRERAEAAESTVATLRAALEASIVIAREAFERTPENGMIAAIERDAQSLRDIIEVSTAALAPPPVAQEGPA